MDALPLKLSSFIRHEWVGKKTPLMYVSELGQQLKKRFHKEFLTLPRINRKYQVALRILLDSQEIVFLSALHTSSQDAAQHAALLFLVWYRMIRVEKNNNNAHRAESACTEENKEFTISEDKLMNLFADITRQSRHKIPSSIAPNNTINNNNSTNSNHTNNESLSNINNTADTNNLNDASSNMQSDRKSGSPKVRKSPPHTRTPKSKKMQTTEKHPLAEIVHRVIRINKLEDHQKELFQYSCQESAIIYVPTDLGKSFVALLLVHEGSHELRDSTCRKWTFFLVPKVHQQADLIKYHTDLRVSSLRTSKEDVENWKKELQENQVIVTTPKILCILLEHSFITLQDINRILFDECHKVKKDPSVAKIVNEYRRSFQNGKLLPKIFGITTAQIYHFMPQVSDEESNEKFIVPQRDSNKEHVDDLSTTHVFLSSKLELIFYRNTYRFWKLRNKLLFLNKLFCKANSQMAGMKKKLEHLLYLVSEFGLVSVPKYLQRILQYSFYKEPSLLSLDDSKQLELLLRVFQRLITHFEQLHDSQILYSPKFQILVKFLEEFQDKENFRCVVFIERETAIPIFFELLSTYESINPFFKVAPLMKRSRDSTLKGSKEVLEQFNSGTVNVLITAPRNESQLDWSRCNVVVRFDNFMSITSFIRLRERISDNGCRIYIFANEKDEQYLKLLGQVQKIEKDFDSGIRVRQTEEREDQYVVPTTGAKVKFQDSLLFFHKVCQKLAINSLFVEIDCCDEYSYKEFQNELYMLLPRTGEVQFVMGRKEESRKIAKRSAALEGIKKLHQLNELDDRLLPVSRKKKFVKRVLQTYQNIPAETREYPLKIPELLKQTWEEIETTTRCVVAWVHCISFTKSYTTQSPNVSSTSPSTTLTADQNTFAILTPCQLSLLDALPKFTLMRRSTRFSIAFYQKPTKMLLTEIEFNKIKYFHLLLFAFILKQSPPPSGFVPSKKNYLVAPVIVETTQSPPKVSIDWQKLEGWCDVFRNTSRSSLNLHNLDELQGAVVQSRYKNDILYQIIDIRKDMNPLSVIPKEDWRIHHKNSRKSFNTRNSRQTEKGNKNEDNENTTADIVEDEDNDGNVDEDNDRNVDNAENKQDQGNNKTNAVAEKSDNGGNSVNTNQSNTGDERTKHTTASAEKEPHKMTFQEYYQRFYNLTIESPAQPILKAKLIGKRQYQAKNFFLKPKPKPKPKSHEIKMRKKSPLSLKFKEVYLVPEFCYAFASSTLFLEEASLLPCILWKIESFLLADELSRIIRQTPIDQQQRHHTNDYPEFLPPWPVLQALTATGTHNPFNYERLETMGDSVLKLLTTIYLFKRYPEYTEGDLHAARAEIVCNMHLAELGRAVGLGNRIFVDSFDPNLQKWEVPGLGGMQTSQWINDKVVADVAEALIGVCYQQSKKLKSLLLAKCFAYLGLNYAFTTTDIDDKTDVSTKNAVSHVVFPPAENIEGLASHIEKKLNYKFRDLKLLREAFTHPSACRYYCGYQRVEFLGDALLEFLVTEHFFNHEDYSLASPGILTEIRSLNVSTNFFAFLTVKFELHKYLKYSSPSIFENLNRFVSNVQPLINEPEVARKLVLTLDAPKVLADIWESLAAAIFLDSGESFETV
jgi:dsRNA-specific ribonuclease/ERCC4-related helicase